MDKACTHLPSTLARATLELGTVQEVPRVPVNEPPFHTLSDASFRFRLGYAAITLS